MKEESELDQVPVSVAAFIDATTATWNMTQLREFFLPMDIEIIQAIPLCNRRFDDLWAWHYERSGIFSVRSA